MALLHNPSVVTSGLVFAVDPANIKSYRENLLTYSENLITNWASGTTTITNNVITAPNGTSSGSFMAEAADTGQHLNGQGVGTLVNGTTYTLSVYAKAGTRTQLGLTAYGEGYSVFNLSTGTVIQTGGNVCTITPVGNGWYRCTAAITKTNTDGSFYLLIWNNTNPYAGIAGYGIYIWGAQVNVGNAAAPYTPTTATAVAKTLNDMSGNGYNSTSANITYNSSGGGSLLFNGTDNFIQCSGSITVTAATFITWMRRNGSQVSYAGILYSRGTNITGITFFGTTNKISYAWNSAGETYNWDSGLTIPDLTWCMIAVSVTGTTATAYLCQSSGITSAANPAGYNHTSTILDDIKIGQDDQGSRFFNGIISSAMIYNRALSATEVAQNFAAHRSRYGV